MSRGCREGEPFGLKMATMRGRAMVQVIGRAEEDQHPLGLAVREKALHARL
jgi:hypothetical protein